MSKKTPKKPPVSYATAHNRAVNTFRKTSMFIFWVGVLGVFATLLGMIQMLMGNFLVIKEVTYHWPQYGFSLALNVEIMISKLLIDSINNDIVSSILCFVISILIGGGFAILGLFGSKGRIQYIYIGAGLYLADFLLMIPVYGVMLRGQFTVVNFLFTLLTHIIAMGAIIIAIIEYYHVFAIERKYKDGGHMESEVIARGE